MSHLFAFLLGCIFTPATFIIYIAYTTNICFDDLCEYDDCEQDPPTKVSTKKPCDRTPLNHETLPQLEKAGLPTPEELSLW